MKVHAFGVKKYDNSGIFEDLLRQVEADGLMARVRPIGAHDMRIEHIQQKDGLWFFDFGKFRQQHGPGKASKSTPIQGFVFKQGEVFCEETACLYVPASGHLLIQYNHHGARAGTIQDYFNIYDQNNSYGFGFLPKYDETVEKKFKDRSAIKKILFEIDPRYLSQSDRVSGTALTQALDIGNESGGEKVELVISAGRAKKSTLRNFIDKTAETLKNMAGTNPDAVTKLRVGVVENLDSNMETIDLIAQRLVHEFGDIPVGADLRMPRDDRYKALVRAYNAWKPLLK